MTQIIFEDVSKEYSPGVSALSNINLKVEPGEFLFLIGPSGAGKSTLIKMLIKEEYPTQGNVYFDDQNILDIDHTLLPELRRRVGVVFQDFKVLPSKTVFENVAVALDVVNSPEEEINEVVPNVLHLVGLLDKSERFPNQLSGGELQRLSIARAFAHEPDVLVADEPTGMIDPVASREILDVLDKINTLGTTVIMSTHDQAIVDSLKKRVVRLDKGQVVSDKMKGKYDE